jgi:hypothetical protein
MESELTDVEVRVLGAMVEKEMTTPLSYPLTLNALTNACNQKSNRFPATSYNEDTVLRSVDSLRNKGLAETVFPGSSRVAKYRHNFAYQYGLNGKLQALLGVMMLRGPQTLGELRTRTERMVRFPDLETITEHLDELITREEGALVMMMPPGRSQKERRYAHLLAGEPSATVIESGGGNTAAPPVAAVDTAWQDRVEILEAEVVELREELQRLKAVIEG